MMFKMKGFLLAAVAVAALIGNTKAFDPGVARGYVEEKGEKSDFGRRKSGVTAETESPFQSIKRWLQVWKYMDEDLDDNVTEVVETARPSFPQFLLRPSVCCICSLFAMNTAFSLLYYCIFPNVDCLSSFPLHPSLWRYNTEWAKACFCS